MAAFNFPNSPSVNDTHTENGISFKWDGTVWKRVSGTGAQGPTGAQGNQGTQGNQGQTGAQAYISDAAPSSGLTNGDLWWDSDSGDFSIYYDDGSGSPSAQWVEVGSTGPTGPTGAQGAQGHQGAAGAAGAQGAQGHQGAAGAQGAQGHQGAAGAQGAQGTAGSATLSNNADNRVITGGSGTNLNAESTLTYDGTNLDLGSNKYLRLGGSNDLQIWHNGSTGNSNIKQVSGHMYFYTGSDLNMLIRDGTSVDLYYANNKVVETHGDGLTFSRGSGNLIKYGTTSEFPNAAINIYRGGNGYANIRLSSNYGCGLFMAGASDNTDEFGINQDNQKNGYLDNRGGFISFNTGSSGTARMRIENSATITCMAAVVPSSDNSYNLGGASNRWAQIYTTDLQLCNKGKKNIVDGTWGDWTLQEGETKIFMINNRTGKKYSLKMEEE